jgi:hypothetical protein
MSFAMISTRPFLKSPTQEYVVPRSMPMIRFDVGVARVLLLLLLSAAADGTSAAATRAAARHITILARGAM